MEFINKNNFYFSKNSNLNKEGEKEKLKYSILNEINNPNINKENKFKHEDKNIINNNEFNIIFQTIFAFEYFKNLNSGKRYSNYLQRLCSQEKMSINQRNLINFFYNNKNDSFIKHKIKIPRNLLNRKKKMLHKDIFSIKSKLQKNSIILSELADIQENQNLNSIKIEKLIYLCQQENFILSNNYKYDILKKNENCQTKNKNFNSQFKLNNQKNSDDFLFLSKFPYFNNASNSLHKQSKAEEDDSYYYRNFNPYYDFNKNKFLKSENFSFILNNTERYSKDLKKHNSPNSNFTKELNDDLSKVNNNEVEFYGYLNTEEANNYSNFNKENFCIEKDQTQKSLTNTFTSNGHIYDYFSFRIRNSKLNNSNTLNTINSDINNTFNNIENNNNLIKKNSKSEIPDNKMNKNTQDNSTEILNNSSINLKLNTNKNNNFTTKQHFNSMILSQAEKHNSEKFKKQAKLNETFCNFNINFNKADFSINHGLTDTSDFRLSKLNPNLKRWHSPDRLLNIKYFGDSDGFKYFNSDKNNMILTNLTNLNFKNSSNSISNSKNLQNFNVANFMDLSSNDTTDKFFKLTSNPFNLKLENLNENIINDQNKFKNISNGRKTKNNIDISPDEKDLQERNNSNIETSNINFLNNKLKHSLEVSSNLEDVKMDNNLENTVTEEIKVLNKGMNSNSIYQMNNQTLRRFKLSGFEESGRNEFNNEIENVKDKSENNVTKYNYLEKSKNKNVDIDSDKDKLKIEDLANNIPVQFNNQNVLNRYKNKILSKNKLINNSILKNEKSEELENKSLDKNELEDQDYLENKKINKNNFQRLKFNNNKNERIINDNHSDITKKRNERIENLNSLSNGDNNNIDKYINIENLNVNSEMKNYHQNRNRQNHELNYMRKNLEKINENSSVNDENSSSINFSGIDHIDKKDNTLNYNNLSNSLINSTNTDNIISSRMSQDKSLISGSDVIFDNYSQNSGQVLIDSKGNKKN